MKFVLTTKNGEVIAQGDRPKSSPLILRVDEGEAFLQIEIWEREFRVTGDGGATRRGTWELELALPRVNEK